MHKQVFWQQKGGLMDGDANASNEFTETGRSDKRVDLSAQINIIPD